MSLHLADGNGGDGGNCGGGGDDGGGGGSDGGDGGGDGGGGSAGGAGARQPSVSLSKPLKRSRLTVRAGRPESLFLEAKQTMASDTLPGVSAGNMARICDATPVTCGHAIDVPEILLVSESEFFHAAVITDPGA